VQMPKSWASSKHLLPGTRSEIIADGIVHAIGVSLGLVGAIFLLLVSHSGSGGDITSIAVYTAGLLAVLGLSAAYNLWPVSPAKWVLRRFDHSAIYALIAATYTPFLAQLKTELAATGLMITVWVTAAIGGHKALPARSVRPARYRALSASRLERGDRLSSRCRGAPRFDFVVARGWRSTLLGRSDLPLMEQVALPERDLAWVRARRLVLPLYGST
jgi:Haemolysin-III related